MEKLHPKAVWLFFFQFFFAFGIFGFLLAIFFIVPFLITIQKAISQEVFALPREWLILFFLLYIIFCYIWAKLTYRFWRYELTEDAIKIEKGVIWKKYISIPYERVQNVDIYRGVFARLLGLSNLQIQTAGYSGGYGRYEIGRTEGKLPGLDVQIAEQLREELIKKVKGTKQGL
ncbi:MAG: PH domain-containing protein [Candidatus Nealsonbacteria bacterium]|nr:MAG: PH domain-containing protein [Candidatus Nealsonbacteria bacterium]